MMRLFCLFYKEYLITMGACAMLCQPGQVRPNHPSLKYEQKEEIFNNLQEDCRHNQSKNIFTQTSMSQNVSKDTQNNISSTKHSKKDQISIEKSVDIKIQNATNTSSENILQIPTRKSCKKKQSSKKVQTNKNMNKKTDKSLKMPKTDSSPIFTTNLKFNSLAVPPKNSIQRKSQEVKILDLCSVGLTSRDRKIIQQTELFQEITFVNQDVYYENQSFYKGQWLNKKRHGNGTLQWKNGTIYIGQFVEDNISGQGKICYHNKQIYEGTFVDNKACGYGQSREQNDIIYKGQWINNLKMGQGCQINKQGQIYTGSWLNGYKNGYGQMFFSDGSYYKGSFKDNQLHGQGEYFWKNKFTYKGSWARNLKNGYGTIQWISGQRYQGDFHDDKMHGRGKYKDLNDILFQGQFIHGKKTGWFTIIFPNGRQQQVEIYYNKIIVSQKFIENQQFLCLDVDSRAQ